MGAVEDLEVRDEPTHEDARDFRLGDDKDKEAFISKFGIDAALGVTTQELKDTEHNRGAQTGGGKLYDEILEWHNRLLDRKKAGTPMSQAASDLGVG